MHLLFLRLFFLLLCASSFAQLPLYTLYYSNPLPINPAFTGSSHRFRAGVNFRNQWSNASASLTAYSVFVDNYFTPINSGIGLSVYSDVAGSSNFRQTRISAYYSYNAKIGDKVFLKAGLEPLIGFTALDQGSLVFNDQLNVTGTTGNASAENLSAARTTFFNLNSGLLLTANTLWIGVSGYNLLMPKIGVGNESKLPIGFGIQAGTKIEFMANVISRKEKKERFLMPHVFFTNTGYSKQLYVGTELVYEPFSVALTGRGNFFSSVNGAPNTSSVALSFGFRRKNVQSNYTYDLPISNKNSLLGPSHEISIRTLFKFWQKPSRRPIERLDLF